MTQTDHRRVDCTCPRARHVHGTEAAYTRDRCRCLPCRLARSTAVAAWKAGEPLPGTTVPIIGTRRRLQALTTLGWSPPELAVHAGMHPGVVRRLRSDEGSHPSYADTAAVLTLTRDRVGVVYDRLWAVPSVGPKATVMRRMALRRGWLPPLAWDDDTIDDPGFVPHVAGTGGVDVVAVQRAVDGCRPVVLTRAERELAEVRLRASGVPVAEIERRLRRTA